MNRLAQVQSGDWMLSSCKSNNEVPAADQVRPVFQAATPGSNVSVHENTYLPVIVTESPKAAQLRANANAKLRYNAKCEHDRQSPGTLER